MTSTENPDIVTSFYERHPYPPPVSDLARYQRSWADPHKRRVEHHRLWPTVAQRHDLSVLVAGCGTSQAARHAIRSPDAHVVGIDLSRAGIEHNRALADRHGLSNLELHVLPIEAIDALAEQFDLIVCTGVVHHLADPDQGLAALRQVLKPNGAVHLMVYARYGRTGIEMMQRYCRMLGLGSSPDEIGGLVAALRELPLQHPMSHVLRSTPDFRHDDAVADALLHPRDRSYDVPEVFALVDRAGLRFGRWFHQAPYSVRCGSPAAMAHRTRIEALPPEEHSAAVELFRGTITRHSLIAYGDEQPTVSFDGDGWLDFVPLKPPTATAVTDRLPPGTSAALLNRAHEFGDLVLFVDDAELEMFQAIDGQRPIRAIPGHDREFFERLWNHDLIVYDATASGSRAR